MSIKQSEIVKYGGALILAASLGYIGYKTLYNRNPANAEDEEQKGDLNHDQIFVDANLDKLHELTKEQTISRSRIISEVHYDLLLSLYEHETEYDGYIRATFQLSEVNESVFFNFEGKNLLYVRVNGEEVPFDKEIYKDHKIYIPVDMLTEGRNIVDIRFTGLYRRDGIGLHRYEDPADGEMYLYTLFQTFSCNKCFPCFDQPDIKATMKFHCFSPSKWAVISNELEENISKTTEVYAKLIRIIG